MHPFSLVTLLSLSTLAAFAAPTDKRWDSHQCLSDNDAQTVATNWGILIEQYSDSLASAVLSENFTDYSESVNTLINSCPQGSAAISLPLLAPTFSDRASFQTGQSQQPSINFKQLNIWHTCDTVMIRWMTTNTANITDVRPVVGLVTMETSKAPSGSQYPFLIDTVYSEFDAGAWLQNLVEAGICTSNAGLPAASGPTTNSASTAALGTPSSTCVSPSTATTTTSASTTWWTPSSSSTAWSQSAKATTTSSSTVYSTAWASTTSYTTQLAYATATVWSA